MNQADLFLDDSFHINRRQFFGRSALGLGTASMASLLSSDLFGRSIPTEGLHHKATAKRVIYLFMSGGPSHIDMWDYKPRLSEEYGKDLPPEVRDGQRITGMTSGQKTLPLAPSKFEFTKCDNNDNGVWVSSLLPYTSKITKELCVVNGTFTEAINHDPAITYIQTGSQIPGRPSLGSWLSYGLGSMNENLPNYVVMLARTNHPQQSLFNRLWGTGFMPSDHQGILFRAAENPVLYLKNPQGVTRGDRRAQLDALAALNQNHYQEFADPEVLSRIKQHEMAYRMQASIPELMDMKEEPKEVFELYGNDARTPGTFAASCLNARRMAQRGVRNIQIFHRGWDSHGGLPAQHGSQCKDIDQACYGLITDLKRQGMLDDTLVVWGGEFGRTNYCQGKLTRENYGRDHHPRAFTTWMAGGGVKPGITYGQSDEYGYNLTDRDGNVIRPNKDHWTPDTMHIHDLNATILHLLGIDHRKLTYRYQGRDFRLTDIHGHVIKDIIA
ncbi:DUF1501 domain-containing protein [Opitutales bacterium]|nr:DUF1501 domain-containing protein [Opitutales bacterium]